MPIECFASVCSSFSTAAWSKRDLFVEWARLPWRRRARDRSFHQHVVAAVLADIGDLVAFLAAAKGVEAIRIAHGLLGSRNGRN